MFRKRQQKAYADPNYGFAWLRLLGALTVVIDHSVPLTDPSRLTVFPAAWEASPGYIALVGFFAMSGYQISDSWERDPSWWRFGARRLLRILPPLVVVVAFTVFVLGPIFTVYSARDYWSDLGTWRYLVGTPLMFLLQHKLPGVFVDNPYPWSVNGSLWTLPMEFVGYVLVLAVGLVISFGVTRYVLLPVLAGMFVLDTMFEAAFNYHGNAGSFLSVPIGSLVSFLTPFVLGMVLHAFRDKIPLSRVAALALVPLYLALHGTALDRYALALMASYGAIVLAHHWPRGLEVDGRWIFGSYGLYIWGMPVQQVIIAVGGVQNEWVLMALALPLAYLCGVASWLLVEAPTQRLRRYLPTPPKPVPSPSRVPG